MRMTRAGTGGPPLVFVHGLACDGTDWHAQVDSLETRTTVVVCELPGHGSSPARPAECTIEAYGAALARALTKLKLPPSILVGHSMGCRVVLEASQLEPDAVCGLVLVDGSRIGEGDPAAAERAMADELAGDGYPRFMRQFFESMFVPSSDPVLADGDHPSGPALSRGGWQDPADRPCWLGRPRGRERPRLDPCPTARDPEHDARHGTRAGVARPGLTHPGSIWSCPRAPGHRRDVARGWPFPADRAGG